MTTHVFIVDEDTFPVHLEYMFAGTGAGNKDHHIGLLADIKRVKAGDKVIFYLQSTAKTEGGFFGIFKIKDHTPLVFYEPNGKYLKDQLEKKLIYRTLIEPDEVFPKSITEYEALDWLPEKPTEILWSLIYRKLRGNRGCTPLTIQESGRLIDLIKEKNDSKKLVSGDGYTYDVDQEKIVADEKKSYAGKFNKIDVLDLWNKKFGNKYEYEMKLEAFLTDNAGGADIEDITGRKNDIIWLGNEVYCGVGMQKIDVVTLVKTTHGIEFRIIELKDDYVYPEIVKQLRRYVRWVSQYLRDANTSNIRPVVVSWKLPDFERRIRKYKKYSDENKTQLTDYYNKVINAFKSFNNEGICMPIEFFEFEKIGNTIRFSAQHY